MQGLTCVLYSRLKPTSSVTSELVNLCSCFMDLISLKTMNYNYLVIFVTCRL